jgi:RNA polymerase sigma factor (sigma-70 family)
MAARACVGRRYPTCRDFGEDLRNSSVDRAKISPALAFVAVSAGSSEVWLDGVLMLHEDKALLDAYRRGESWAYTVLYREYGPAVRRFLAGGFTFVSQGRTCRYRGSNAGVDIDAVVQESFARAFQASTRATYDGERPFKNYLLSIAKNLVLRELARAQRLSSLDSMEEGSDVVFARARSHAAAFLPDTKSPEKATADGELAEITRGFIDTLTPEEARFFQHRFANGLTQEATAEVLGCTRARVKLLERNLRRAFLAELRGRGYFVDRKMAPRWQRKAA